MKTLTGVADLILAEMQHRPNFDLEYVTVLVSYEPATGDAITLWESTREEIDIRSGDPEDILTRMLTKAAHIAWESFVGVTDVTDAKPEYVVLRRR